MVIDDDAGSLRVMHAVLRRLGHMVVAFSDPRDAVAGLSGSDVDLVISDVQMPGLDGFAVAEHVAQALGTAPPKVLLVSGSEDGQSRMQATPPSVVIGLLAKPFEYATVAGLLSLLEQSRTCCPGIVAPICRYSQHRDREPCDSHSPSALCCSPGYADCPHYAGCCAETLRLWIETHNHVEQEQLAV